MNYVTYVFCMLIWGLNFIAVKIQGDAVSLEVALLYRSMIALILFSILLALIFKNLNVKTFNIWTVLGFGLCNFTLSYLLLYYGTFYSTAAMVTLIFSMKAILTPIFISFVFKSKIPKRIYWGGLFGIMSVAVILYLHLEQLSPHFIVGLFMAIIGTVITSIGDVLSLYNSQRQTHPVLANTIGMLGTLIFLLLYTLFKGETMTFPHEAHFWVGLIYLAVFASFFAWLFYLKLIKNIGAAESGYMVAMFPAIGGAASVIMGESQLTMSLVLGILLTCLGAFIALRKPKENVNI